MNCALLSKKTCKFITISFMHWRFMRLVQRIWNDLVLRLEWRHRSRFNRIPATLGFVLTRDFTIVHTTLWLLYLFCAPPQVCHFLIDFQWFELFNFFTQVRYKTRRPSSGGRRLILLVAWGNYFTSWSVRITIWSLPEVWFWWPNFLLLFDGFGISFYTFVRQ